MPSTAAYIIICNGRIEVAAAKDPADKIQAASRAAMNLTSFLGERATFEDTQPLSDLQHEMMDNLNVWSKSEVAAKVAVMFGLLDALEDKFSD